MTEQTAASTQKRLHILGDDEIDILYGLPRFTAEEQKEYFALSLKECAVIEQLHRIKSRIYAILQLGYFKARHLFFIFSFSMVAADAKHIQERYFPAFELTDLEPAKVTRLNQQRLILELCNYRTCDDEARETLMTRDQQVARVCGKPIYIFRELMHHLEAQRLVAPGYSVMQNLVGQAITHEQNRLSTAVHSHLEETDIDALNRLLEDSPGLYEITQLKRDKDFSLGEIKQEIYRGEQIQGVLPPGSTPVTGPGNIQ